MPSSSPFSNHPSQASAADSEGDVLVRVEGVSKIFCRDLKKSLLYGLQDSARDLLSWGKKSEFRDQSSASSDDSSSSTLDLRRQTSSSSRASGSRALRHGEFLAVDNVSFELRRGECLGLIGHNGAGKTTLLKMLNGLMKPDAGKIEMRGSVGALIALGAGFNPLLTGRENIYVNGAILGLSKKQISAALEEIIAFSDIKDAIDAPTGTYSSGMQVRLGFAIASNLNPEILLIDEVLAVGDLSFRNKCMTAIKNFVSNGGTAIIVSHHMQQISSLCDRACLLEKGQIEVLGSTADALYQYVNLQNRNRTLAVLPEPHELSQGTVSDFSAESLTGDEVITFDEPFKICAKLELDVDLSNAGVAFTVLQLESETQLCKYISTDFGIGFDFKKGKNEIELELNPTFLRPGEYRCKFSIIDTHISLAVARHGFDSIEKFKISPTRHPAEQASLTHNSLFILTPHY